MSTTIDFPIQEIESHFPFAFSEQEISPLIRAINRADLDAFVQLIDRFDLNEVYDQEDFPEPQRLSQFLLFRFLALITVEGEEYFPSGFPHGAEFIKVVLERKPNLTFYLTEGYSFADFIKDRREMLIESIADMHAHPERYAAFDLDALLQCDEVELSQIELIADYLSL